MSPADQYKAAYFTLHLLNTGTDASTPESREAEQYYYNKWQEAITPPSESL